MSEVFEISKFDSYREDNRREVKKAKGGLPNSLWDSYSSFANSYGGVIILGVGERADGSWYTTGLKDADKHIKDFWNTINDPKKVSINILTESNVQKFKVNDDVIIVVTVPMASVEDKPIYINNDMFRGTFRRNGEGDYHCTKEQVKSMLRDQTQKTYDMEIVEMFQISDLNIESVHGYRNSHRFTSEGHPFEKQSDDEYLRSIGAAAISEKDGKLHPTVAGLLMFGNEYDIVRKFPEYFLDYRESMDPEIRWTDRVYSSTGDWSGNLFDFYYRVYNKIKRDIKVPFALKDGRRIDDTPIHKAVREALANCLINADYFGVRGVVIKKDNDSLVFENPGYIRTGKHQMRKGGVSDPRNKALMKMFNLLDIGERSGSGVPSIFDAWNELGFDEPVIDEIFDPDRTILTLPLSKSGDRKSAIKIGDKKSAIKIGDKKSAIKISSKTMERIRCIYNHMEIGKEYGASQLIDIAGVKESRLRDLLGIMIEEGMIASKGERKSRVYIKLPRIDL